MNSNFVHLHCHSAHSYNDGCKNPDQILDVAKAKGFEALALTDHGNLDGAISFYFDAKKRDIKAILGVEAYICNDIKMAVAGGPNPIKHITLLAKNAKGYTNLCKLMTVAHSKEGYFRRPRIDWELLEKEGDGLIVLSGCSRSAIFDNISLLERLKARFGADFYLEVMPIPEPDDYSAKASFTHDKAKSMGIKTVLTGNVHFPSSEDYEIHDVMMAIKTDNDFHAPERPRIAPNLYLRDREEMFADSKLLLPWMDVKSLNQAADMTLEIASKVDIKLETDIPVRYDCGSKTSMGLLKERVEEGIKARKMNIDKIYQARIDREMRLIDTKGFADYFLVVADVIGWAKSHDILVGPARGSSAGSLVCYLLAITEVNPIPFGLLFERFIDENRQDLPDIDIDFEDRHRDKIIQYLKARYVNVGVLSAWSAWGAKSCLLDVARAFKIPQWEVRKVTPLVIQRSGGDARASFTLMDTFTEFPVAKAVLDSYPELEYASHLEGIIKQKTRHAAGVIISSKPISTFASTYGDDCISIGKGETKSLGALKLDVLGINTLTVVAEILKLIKERHGMDIDIYNLPLEDENVLAGFRARKLAGIFQYEGGAMKSVNRRIPASCFADLALINAASRPGPLHCGGTASYTNRRAGREAVEYCHPIAKEITKETLGVIMYQEQVIKLMGQLGKMNWTDTSTARKVMSDRQGTEVFNKLFEKFKKGAMENGLTEAASQEVWSHICTHGSWSFNASHAYSYSIISYWTMYLKVYFPAEFYCASIGYTSNEEREIELTKEFKKEGGRILQVDSQKSTAKPSLEGDDIRMGWEDVAGVGEKLAERLAYGAPYKSTADLVQRTGIKAKQLALLEDLGIVARLQMDMFKTADLPPDKVLLMKHCPWLFDMDLTVHRTKYCRNIDTLEATEEKQNVTIVGVIRSVGLRDLNEINGQRGRESFKKATGQTKFANLIVEDEHDGILVTFSRKNYPQWQDTIWKDGGVGNIVKVEGVILPDMRKIYGSVIKILGNVNQSI